MPDLTLPRSVLAALWLPHVTDLGSVTRASEAITGDDEPHVAVLGRTQLNLPGLFATWAPARVVGAALPTPGRLAGAPAQTAADAVAAGECLVVAARTTTWVAVPIVQPFGTALEPGASVSWSVTEAPGAEHGLLASLGSLSDARSGLAHALATATEALARLDLARSVPETAQRIAELAEASAARTPDWPLPPQVGHDRLELLVRAVRLLAIVDLAREAPTAAVTTWQEDQRGAALREVDVAARQAMSAATAYVR